MALEFAPEFVNQLERRAFGRCDLAGEMADLHVLAENPGDERLVGIDEAGARREQDLLLLSEVLAPLGLPVLEEALTSISGARSTGTPEALRHHERVMVIAREFCERGVTFQGSADRLTGYSYLATTRRSIRGPSASQVG